MKLNDQKIIINNNNSNNNDKTETTVIRNKTNISKGLLSQSGAVWGLY